MKNLEMLFKKPGNLDLLKKNSDYCDTNSFTTSLPRLVRAGVCL